MAVLLMVGYVVIAYAWGSVGHRIINSKAMIQLPASMSVYHADSVFITQHASDADARKVSSDTSMYAEAPRHFLDLDDYPNWQHLSHSFDTLVMLYGWQRVKDNGTLPWTTAWLVDSLAHQIARGDVMVPQTMADIGHYVGDAHQPLHCTANYDGGLSVPSQRGIHSRYESTMLGTFQSLITIQPDSVHYIADPLEYAFSYIYYSNLHVDSILQADTYAKTVSGWTGSGSAPSSYYDALWEKTGSFTEQLFQNATVDLASMWYTAWVNAQLISTGVPVPKVFPDIFELQQNYPNPFNPSTTIRFTIKQTASVRVKVYDAAGREMATLMNSRMEPGEHQVLWNASGAASGIYIVRLDAGAFTQTRKMLLLR